MRSLLLCINFLFALDLQGQQDFVLIERLPCEGDMVTVDELGNVYTQNSRHIERWNAQGGGKFRNSELQYGHFERIDVTDPLRPFIHFAESGKLVFFDNTLSVQGSPIDLFEKGFEQIECVAGSRGDAFWLWDSRALELIRVDRNFQRLASTGNLAVLLGASIVPVQLMERGNYLCVRTEDNYILVFDMYGTFKKRIRINAINDMQVINDRVYLYDDPRLKVIHIQSGETTEFNLPQEAKAFYTYRGMLYGVAQGVLFRWKYPENARN